MAGFELTYTPIGQTPATSPTNQPVANRRRRMAQALGYGGGRVVHPYSYSEPYTQTAYRVGDVMKRGINSEPRNER